jgi:hypothetical protein
MPRVLTRTCPAIGPVMVSPSPIAYRPKHAARTPDDRSPNACLKDSTGHIDAAAATDQAWHYGEGRAGRSCRQVEPPSLVRHRVASSVLNSASSADRGTMLAAAV